MHSDALLPDKEFYFFRLYIKLHCIPTAQNAISPGSLWTSWIQCLQLPNFQNDKDKPRTVKQYLPVHWIETFWNAFSCNRNVNALSCMRKHTYTHTTIDINDLRELNELTQPVYCIWESYHGGYNHLSQ